MLGVFFARRRVEQGECLVYRAGSAFLSVGSQSAPCLCSRSSHAVTLTLLPPSFLEGATNKRRIISAQTRQQPPKGHEKIL